MWAKLDMRILQRLALNFENLLRAENINLNKITFEIFIGNMSM